MADGKRRCAPTHEMRDRRTARPTHILAALAALTVAAPTAWAQQSRQPADDSVEFKPNATLYEAVVDIGLTTDGKSKSCKVVRTSAPSLDICGQFELGEPMVIPLMPSDTPLNGTVRLTIKVEHKAPADAAASPPR